MDEKHSKFVNTAQTFNGAFAPVQNHFLPIAQNNRLCALDASILKWCTH